MSGRIRTNLGRARKNAETHLTAYDALLANNPVPWTETTKVEFAMIDAKLQKDLHNLETGFESWVEVIDAIEDKTAGETEQCLYDAWFDNPDYSNVIEKVNETISMITGYLKLNVPNQNNGNGLLNHVPACVGAHEKPPSKVPSLEMPKYSGDLLKWNSFWQRFKHSVHDQDYPKIEKLISLLSNLEGRAQEEVEGFEVSEENYDTIVGILQERFGNSTLIIKKLQSKLRSLPQANSTSESIRTTVNAITNMCRQLQNLGVGIDNESMKLDVIEKMPTREKNKLLVLSVLKKDTNIETILEKMKEFALTSEIISENDSKNETNVKQVSDSSQPHVTPSAQTSPPKKCTLCDGFHFMKYCPKFPTAQQRIDELKVKHRCIRCTQNTHFEKQCVTKLKCKACQGRHHTAVCLGLKPVEKRDVTSAFFSAPLNPTETLLGTTVIATNPIKDIQVDDTFTFFDAGSMRSYISEKLAKKLNLDTLNTEKLTCTGFGGKKSTFSSGLVQFTIKTSEGPKEILANTSPNLLMVLPTLEKSEEGKIEIRHQVPDILIGIEYFFDFVKSSEKVEDRFTCIHSIVGDMYVQRMQRIPETICGFEMVSASTDSLFCIVESPLKPYLTNSEGGREKPKDGTPKVRETKILPKLTENSVAKGTGSPSYGINPPQAQNKVCHGDADKAANRTLVDVSSKLQGFQDNCHVSKNYHTQASSQPRRREWLFKQLKPPLQQNNLHHLDPTTPDTSSQIQLSNGFTTRRPINHLYPLEEPSIVHDPQTHQTQSLGIESLGNGWRRRNESTRDRGMESSQQQEKESP